MSDINHFAKDIQSLDQHFNAHDLHLYELREGGLAEKKGWKKVVAKLGYFWSWITGRVEKQQLQKFQTLFNSCLEQYEKSKANPSTRMENREVVQLSADDVQKVVQVFQKFQPKKTSAFVDDSLPLVRKDHLIHSKIPELHKAFKAEHGEVEIKDNQPNPSEKQLKAAFEMVNSDPILSRLLEKSVGSPEQERLMARAIQTLMLGDAVKDVPYPEEITCFTFKEAKQMNVDVSLSVPEEYENFLDWHLKSNHQEGVEDKKEQYLEEFQKDVGRMEYVINGEEFRCIENDAKVQFDQRLEGWEEEKKENIKLVAFQVLFFINPLKLGCVVPNLIKRFGDIELVATGMDQKIYITGKDKIEAVCDYEGKDFHNPYKVVCRMRQSIEIENILGKKDCGKIRQSDLRVSPWYKFNLDRPSEQ